MGKRNMLVNKLEKFISKYYKNLLLKGGIYFVSIFLLFFILFSVLEHFGQFNTSVRSALFWTFVVLNTFIFWNWIVKPLKGLYRLGGSLSHLQAAKIIGQHFSSIEDRLINLLQLQELSTKDNALVEASINQKLDLLQPIPFSKAINLRSNATHLKYAIVPVAILCLLFLSGNKEVVVGSSSRILSYNTDFVPQAPFQFIIDNTSLSTTKATSFLLKMHFEGSEVPKKSSIVIGKNRYEMSRNKTGNFSFLFKNPQQSQTFRFEANGFLSGLNTLNVIPRPSVNQFNIRLTYPKYTKLKTRVLENVGNIQAPEGTTVKWSVFTKDSEQVFLRFEKIVSCNKLSDSNFEFKKRFLNSASYSLFAQNEYLVGDSILYEINIIKDVFPSIEIKESYDSLNSMQRYFEGSVEDDYGIKDLNFKYRFLSDTSQWNSTQLESVGQSNRQAFNYTVNFRALGLLDGTGVEYYFEAWDNDGINGSKSTKTSLFNYQAASVEELMLIAEEEDNQLKKDINESKKMAEEIQKDIAELRRQLLKNKELSWEDKQKTKELLEKQESLKNKIENVQKKQKENQITENQFQKPDDNLLKKQQEIQRLFESIMSEEMKEIMKDLDQMMNDIDKEELQKLLDEMQQSDEDVEKELDRTLELFKQMELQQKLEKSVEDLQELAKKQKELAERSKDGSADNDALKKEQEKLNEEFEDLQKDLEKTQKLNQKLENKQDIPDTKNQEEEIKKNMQESVNQLQKNMKKQAAKKQKQAADKIEEMSQSIQSAMQQALSETLSEDMQRLRQILENLITLSLDQEDVLQSIISINLNSPLYLDYLQLQNKLQADAKIIEDSLFALSKRQPQIESVVNREIGAINNSMEKAIVEMAERRSSRAREQQQFAMTSANNLALILSEVLEQMQKEMANMEPRPSSKMCNKPNSSSSQGMKEMKKLQEQIKAQMENMMKGKSGKKSKSSKGIAQLAAQQEMIRKRMGEIRKELGKNKAAKKNIDTLIKEMEENEVDIIKNQITRETLLRQEAIMTRLLESDKALRNRDTDKARESNEWIDNLSKRLVNNFEDYQKEKERQEELLRTIPPSFTPFYKDKIKDYFKNDGK